MTRSAESRRWWAGVALLVAGCAATPTPPPRTTVEPPRVITSRRVPIGTDAVLGRTAPQLEAAFGVPVSQLVEGPARRLQFTGPLCVMDTYLYASEGGDPTVTHVDTRTPTGEDIDRATCVAALRKR